MGQHLSTTSGRPHKYKNNSYTVLFKGQLECCNIGASYFAHFNIKYIKKLPDKIDFNRKNVVFGPPKNMQNVLEGPKAENPDFGGYFRVIWLPSVRATAEEKQ